MWGSPELSEVLAARAATGETWERGTALVALAAGKDPQGGRAGRPPPPADKDDALRARAAEAAGEIGLPAAGAAIERLAGDPSPRVRSAALSAWLEADPKAADVARKALADPDVTVRGTAFDWLTTHPVLPLEDLGAALPGVYQEGTVEAGLAAVRAVVARAQGEPLQRGAAVGLLEKLAEGGPYVLRREVGEGLGQARPAGARAGARPSRGRTSRSTARSCSAPASPTRSRSAPSEGRSRVRLACPAAPLTCLNFLNLAGQGFFDGLAFHRVVPDFVVQGGDPKGDGSGGPGYSIRDEINRLRYDRGVVGMALAGPDTGGSQFFITLSPQPHLDGGYTAFGEVIAGAEVLDQIRLGDRIEKVVGGGAMKLPCHDGRELSRSPSRSPRRRDSLAPRGACAPLRAPLRPAAAASATVRPSRGCRRAAPTAGGARAGRRRPARRSRRRRSGCRPRSTPSRTPRAAQALAAVEPGAEVTVYLGTWCGDSRREVPRFWKAVDAAGGSVPFAVRYVGVDHAKKEPADLLKQDDVRYLPTIIVRRGGKEVGRIVETSPHGVEQDLLALLTGKATGVLSTRQDLAPAAPKPQG